MSFWTNSDWYQVFSVKDGGVPVDITGKNLAISLRASASDSSTLIDMSTGAGTLTITDGPAGLFAVDVPNTQSSAVPAGNHYWDLVEDKGNGRQSRIAGGRWLVRKGITD